MKVVYHPAAQLDLLESVEFYELRRPGLGASFYLEIEAVIAGICEDPLRHPPTDHPEIRRAMPARFPYWDFYQADDTLIEVLAVAHQRRDPLYWQKRLDD